MPVLGLDGRHTHVLIEKHGFYLLVPVLGLAGGHKREIRKLQVRFHDDIDGSSLARAIYASTGPLRQ